PGCGCLGVAGGKLIEHQAPHRTEALDLGPRKAAQLVEKIRLVGIRWHCFLLQIYRAAPARRQARSIGKVKTATIVFCFDRVSLREPISISLESALALKSPARREMN